MSWKDDEQQHAKQFRENENQEVMPEETGKTR